MKRLISLILCMGMAALCSGCQRAPEPVSKTGFFLDTVVTVTLYDKNDPDILESCFQEIAGYEKIFSRTDPESELWGINHREEGELSVSLSEPMRELIERGLYYCELSGGAFDITLAPLSELWNFGGTKHFVPENEKITEALSSCGYQKISLSENVLTFESPETMLDLGALAKGYIADRLKDYLTEQGVTSAVIDLGGNILCIGEKPDGSPFKIGVRKPFSGDSVRVANAKNLSIVASGVYERYFVENGVRYHHILNPKTGYPYETELLSVTVFSESSLDGDGFSTLLFALGREDGMKLANSLEGIEAIFIDSNQTIYYSDGAEELLLPEQKGV